MAFPSLAELAAVLRAEDARLNKRPHDAVKILQPLITGHERYQTRVALQEAYAAAGDLGRALEQGRWLQGRRGLAYMEQGCGQCLQALNVADSNLSALRSAEILSEAGRRAEARQALDSFDQHWPDEAIPPYLSERRAVVIAASN
jgi:hypothetical protein